MTTKIIHKKSSVASRIPTASDLEVGEIALNLADKKIYTKDTNGNVIELATSSAAMNTYKYTSTASQTTFSGSDDASATLAYTSGAIIVTVNGVVYEDGTDYTATNGTSIVFTSGLEVNDEVNIIAFTSSALTTIDYSDISNTPTIPTALTDLSITDGTDGQVLTTDGSGAFTFEDAASPYGDTEVSSHLNTGTANADEVLSWDGSDFEWIERGNTFSTFSYIATNGQTTFSGADSNSQTLAYTADKIIVTLNGIVLKDTTDYTATNGTSVVLTSGAQTGQELTVMAFDVFEVANIDYSNISNTPTLPTDFVSAANGGTFSGNVSVTGDLTVDTDTLYVDSTNNKVGIGTDSPVHELTVKNATQTPTIRIHSNTTSFPSPRLEFVRGTNDTFGDDNYSDYRIVSDSGHLIFQEGSNSTTQEFMRLDNSGNVLLGKTSTSISPMGCMLKPNGQIFSTTNGSDSFHNYDTSQNRYEFYVKSNGGIANYSSNNVNLSDETEKKNITAAASAWDDVKGLSLKEFHYTFEDDADPKQLGVIAQEVQVNHPDLIKSFKIDDDTNKLGVVEQQVTWMAIKALQEAMTKIETLETQNADILQRLETLENNNE